MTSGPQTSVAWWRRALREFSPFHHHGTPPTVPWGDPPVFHDRPTEKSSGDVSSGEGSGSTQG